MGKRSIGQISAITEQKKGSAILLRLFASIEDTSWITTVPLKTGGNGGWIMSWPNGLKNHEQNRLKDPFPVGGKWVKVAQEC